MAERWLPVVGYNGLYEVSDLGRVRSLHRAGVPHIMASSVNSSGHLYITLVDKGDRWRVAVHRLVLDAFVGLAPEGHECRHLNGIPSHNVLGNLEWSTRTRNFQDKKYHRGTTIYKLRPEQVREIKQRLGTQTGRSLAAEFGVTPSTICDINRGRYHLDVAA